VVNLISIHTINKDYLHYSDLRAVFKWFRDKNIPVIKMGKRHYVTKEDIENLVAVMLGKAEEPETKETKTIQKATKGEQQIARDLLQKMRSV
jgi:hypothetical protein